MVKIADAIKQAGESQRRYFGFEFFAPTSEAGIITLYDRVERLAALDPLFCSITWGDHGATADTSVEVASTCQTLLSVNYQVNLTGYTSTPEQLSRWLAALKAKGVRNVLATRGNATSPPSESETVHFPHAVDLVRFIRAETGDHFGIAVVAAPEAADLEAEVRYLREKIDAGAEYVITQPVFDAKIFLSFVARCAEQGIRCPILPGVLPVAHRRQLRTLGLLERRGAAGLAAALEAAEALGEAEVRQAVIHFTRELVRALFAGGAGGVYLFTMNTDAVILSVIKELDLTTHRAFPWKPSENEERRHKETVRPIHWSSRVTSYMVRTAQWRGFQSGDKWSPDLWGGSGGYHARLLLRSRAKRCVQFLTLAGMADIPQALEELCRIFVNFFDGNGTLPWADELSGETEYVNEIILKPLNARGLFTINSQLQVNGVASSNRVVGWGPPNGFIYQKGYVEFFCPAATGQTVFTTLDRYPTLQYMAMDAQGRLVRSNWPVAEEPRARTATTKAAAASTGNGSSAAAKDGDSEDEDTAIGHLTSASARLFGAGITAVTWGVFPGREVIQPTIVSVDSFRAWVGEAFDLWAAPFSSNDIPPVVRVVRADWVLLSVVDNMYQEAPSPLERAVLEVCSKVPPLIPIKTATGVAAAASPLDSRGGRTGPL